MQAPRLVKYDFSSGRAMPSALAGGLPSKPSASYAAWASGAKYTPAATGSTALRSRRARSRNSVAISSPPAPTAASIHRQPKNPLVATLAC
jgi:hypothetical protein